MKYQLYCIDTETTGLDERLNEIIELSIDRLATSEQRTWLIRPTDFEAIQPDAMRVNGHSIDDLRRGFRVTAEGVKEPYLDPAKALVEIEEFLMEDLSTASDRIIVGQNSQFDKMFLQNMWKRLGQSDTFPFGRLYLDTIQIAIFLDYINGTERQSYHLNGLVKDLDVKKEKAHRAANDVKMTKDVFYKLVSMAKKNV